MNNSVYAYESCENKIEWCNKYLEKETEFCKILEQHNIKGIINPEKDINKYVPDLLVDGKIADLKYRETPFYSSKHIYGIDPQYAITFNVKDYNHYKQYYPDIIIFFWINFKKSIKIYRNTPIEINDFTAFYYETLPKLGKILAISPIHSYIRRQNDTMGNAKNSFIFDCRCLQPIDNLAW